MHLSFSADFVSYVVSHLACRPYKLLLPYVSFRRCRLYLQLLHYAVVLDQLEIVLTSNTWAIHVHR